MLSSTPGAAAAAMIRPPLLLCPRRLLAGGGSRQGHTAGKCPGLTQQRRQGARLLLMCQGASKGLHKLEASVRHLSMPVQLEQQSSLGGKQRLPHGPLWGRIGQRCR